LKELRQAVEQYEKAVETQDWPRAVSHDLHFHTLLIRFTAASGWILFTATRSENCA
jgi:DNA-binding GntR family transcriptional regulator